jgi:hypothetical protein
LRAGLFIPGDESGLSESRSTEEKRSVQSLGEAAGFQIDSAGWWGGVGIGKS